jgi:transposase
MISWQHDIAIYLHRDPVDFRKSINGLSVIVTENMERSPMDPALYVFCNKRRTQLKVLYWDYTGFALWHKRLEQDKFKWPNRIDSTTITITHEQWNWLLRGFDFTKLKPHAELVFSSVV